MKLITNTSLQSWSLPFRTEKGVEAYFLQPNQTIKVPASYITERVLTYHQRSLIVIRNA